MERRGGCIDLIFAATLSKFKRNFQILPERPRVDNKPEKCFSFPPKKPPFGGGLGGSFRV
jgi:hypothetical protein